MVHSGWAFDYMPSDQRATRALIEPLRSLFIISDYSARMLADDLQWQIAAAVQRGAGLLMIGGWESFHGSGGNWDKAALGKILPVEIAAQDDRINCDQPALVVLKAEHPITAGLPWNDRPPTIGGFNAVTAKPQAQVLLEVERYAVRRSGNATAFEARDRQALLVAGMHGAGRVAALATDAAPHWVGGLVDWGHARVTAKAPDADEVEVGNLYTQFFRQLLGWTGKLQ